VDACHFVLGAYVGYLWCFERQILKTPSGRQRYSVLGAVDSHTKELITARTKGNINAMSVCELFCEIRRLHPDGEITLVMDNASYQHSWFTKLGAGELGIELLFLPAYSPNLNIIERLWKLVKKNCLTNRYYDNFSKFQAAIDRCLDSVNSSLQEEVASLLTLNFHFFGKLKT
jgi:transposase